MTASTAGSAASTFPGLAGSVPAARSFVRHRLAGHPLADDAEVVVSELVTNALIHTPSGAGGEVTVIVERRVASVRLEVVDGGVTGVVLMPVVADELAESCRGLMIVHALAAAWGDGAALGGRHRVWVELVVPGSVRDF